ncbi:hypothetical protein PR048_014174 [Dryococelus australis]|uniref:Uncharacterized protein n=1 Tax=Dryococelus australis TaxID=614101 RepID=A0ABQ9HDQ3_9NEOP|nr:hypothetical protein PR048_014174 [Dryococelus australis]
MVYHSRPWLDIVQNYQELLQPRSVTTQPVVALPLSARTLTQPVARLLPEAETRQLYASSQTEPASQKPEPEIQQSEPASQQHVPATQQPVTSITTAHISTTTACNQYHNSPYQYYNSL